jgi:hypothetical protein
VILISIQERPYLATNDITPTDGIKETLYTFEDEDPRGQGTFKGSKESSLFKPRRHIEGDSLTAAIKEKDR